MAPPRPPTTIGMAVPLVLLAISAVCMAVSPAATHYDVLGVGRAAEHREVQRAYRRAALLEHPDKSDRPDAEERFRRVAEAFEVLSNAELRAQYDFDLEHGGPRHGGGQPRGGMDPYEMFKNHVGDVWEHWRPGFHVEGDVIRGHERVRVVLYPDGSSEVSEAEDSEMHRFEFLGNGWCHFAGLPATRRSDGLTEVDCRRRCLDLRPGCEGYAFARDLGTCEVYKRPEREEDVEPWVGRKREQAKSGEQRRTATQRASVLKADGTSDKESGVVCYQQDDEAFDTSANLLQRTVVIKDDKGGKSTVVTEMVCRKQERTPYAAPSVPAPPPWSTASWPGTVKRVLVALTGGGYHFE